MTRNAALRIAIDALRHEKKRWLYLSDSKVSDDKRAEIAAAIALLEAELGQRSMF